MNTSGQTGGGLLGKLILAIALAIAGGAANVPAQTNTEPGILFLHLQLKNHAVTLIKSGVRPGHLKSRPFADFPDGLHFELTDAGGRALWRGAIEHPASRTVDYEDPPRSGKLKRKRIHLTDPEFTVRVPALTEARRIEFFTLDSPGAAKQERRKSLGSVVLPKP